MTPDHKLATLQEVFPILFQCHIHAVSCGSNKHMKLVSGLADKLGYNFFIHKVTTVLGYYAASSFLPTFRATNLAHLNGGFP